MIVSLLPHYRLRTQFAGAFPLAGVIILAILSAPICVRTLRAQDKLLPVFHFQQVKGRPPAVVWSRVVRDSLGFVWIGTANGLERFDGYGIKEYRNAEHDPYSISSNIVRTLFCDSRKRLWIGTEYTGVCLYDRFRDRFFSFPLPRDSVNNLAAKFPRRFVEDATGNIWFPAKGGIVRVDVPSRFGPSEFDSLVRHIRFNAISISTPQREAYDLCYRRDGKYVVGTDSGLFILDPLTLRLSRPKFTDRLARRLDSIAIACLVQEPNGMLWVATTTEGLYRLDWNQGTATNYRHREGDGGSIRYDDVLNIELDPRGNLWVNTIKGLDLFSPAEGRCIPYSTFGSAPGAGLRPFISVDNTGTLWFASSNGVHWLSPRSLLLPHYSQRNANGSLRMFETVERDHDGVIWCFSQGMLCLIETSTMKIVNSIDVLRGKTPDFRETADRTSSVIDRRGDFWYAAWDLGLYRVNLHTKRVDNYNYRPFVGKSSSVRSIAQGSGDSLWVGTFYEGVLMFNPSRASFSYLGLDTVEAGVTRVSDGTVWISTVGEGLIVYNPSTGKTTKLVHSPSDPHSLSDNLARVVYEDPSGRIWVGAGSAINLWDPETSTFRRYPNQSFEKGLFAIPIGSDLKGRVWIRNIPDGMSFLDPANGKFTNFDFSNGLSGSPSDLQVLGDGRILLTGTAGVNIFHPDSLNYARCAPSLLITQLIVNDSIVSPLPLLRGSDELRLAHDQNVVELTFAAIDIDAPNLVNYEYKLIGLERDWVRPKGRRYVRYTALNPGEYTFTVRASSSWREWPDQEVAFAFAIAPPWWRTAWAYALYIFLIAGLLLTVYRVRLQQIRMKQRLEMEHFQTEHLAEVDRMKSRFFANISHEFRTPLTLILGPADRVMETTEESSTRQNLHLIKDNAKKLFGLVTQLLDFSRLESGMIRLQVSSGDIVQFLRRVVLSFESWAEKKHIHLEFLSDAESMQAYFDADKLEKIVNNLMSNAVKFTCEDGRVLVHVSRGGGSRIAPAEPAGLEISVTDTGQGISPNHLPRIFDRFYRVNETHTIEGTGIGLALTKELVALHHGTITVESLPGKGSVFVVTIPIEQSAYGPDEIVESPPPTAEKEDAGVADCSEESNSPPSTPAAEGKPIVLVVEDNVDLRTYIRDDLAIDYAVYEAGNGKQGYEVALDVVPDLVISDVMMPEMDGMELCQTLKQDVRTSHIPVILLTARAGTDCTIEGLEIGADDYVTKPFDSRELVARARNLIEQRRRLRAKFSTGVVLKPGEVAVTSIDDALLKQIMETVEKNMENVDFGVDDLASAACLSRRHVNRKVHALTNLSPGELIRYVRLQRARELLEKRAGSVAEIAYQVGFGNLSHFSASFKERFGVVPSDVRGNQQKE